MIRPAMLEDIAKALTKRDGGSKGRTLKGGSSFIVSLNVANALNRLHREASESTRTKILVP